MNFLTTSKVIAYLAIIFIAGGTAGAVITLKNARQRDVQPPSVEKACNRFQHNLVTRLGLTPDQVTKLQPVFDQTARELRSIHTRAIRESDQVICKAHQQIATELTPEQKEKLQEFEKERREWLRKNNPASSQTSPADGKKKFRTE